MVPINSKYIVCLEFQQKRNYIFLLGSFSIFPWRENRINYTACLKQSWISNYFSFPSCTSLCIFLSAGMNLEILAHTEMPLCARGSYQGPFIGGGELSAASVPSRAAASVPLRWRDPSRSSFPGRTSRPRRAPQATRRRGRGDGREAARGPASEFREKGNNDGWFLIRDKG